MGDLRTDIAAAENRLRELRNQEREELRVKHRKAVQDAREARNKAEALVREFEQQKLRTEHSHAAFDRITTALDVLDQDRERELFPTEQETADYEREKKRLLVAVDAKRQEYTSARAALSSLGSKR